jgi:hypothetical protein
MQVIWHMEKNYKQHQSLLYKKPSDVTRLKVFYCGVWEVF